MGFIYQIVNNVSKKCYIGQSRQKHENDRWSQHKHNAFKRESTRIALYDAMRSYGIEAFEYNILERDIDNDTLNDVERKYILNHNCRVPNGYNITPGGDHNPHSEETKRKIGEKSKGRKATLGQKRTDEQKNVLVMRQGVGSLAKKQKST